MAGSVVEHSQNRKGKLDGVRAWHFLYVMDSLQLMLQSSLFLFGCGLLASLWQSNKAAVDGITTVICCGLLIFLSVSIAGAVSENSPYQTSMSGHPRDLWKRVQRIIHPKTALELRSISWILRTSPNEATRLTAFKYLMSIPELPKFDPSLVANCFHVFIASIGFRNNQVMIKKGSEHLATMSAMCLFRTFHHLSVTDPTSSTLKDLRQCYDRIFPLDASFGGLPFHRIMTMVHISIKKCLGSRPVEWDYDGLPAQERTPLAWYMAEAARVGYEETEGRKVPRWVLCFALESLPLDPLSPPSVAANCLRIIAIDLGCDVSSVTTVNERCVQTR